MHEERVNAIQKVLKRIYKEKIYPYLYVLEDATGSGKSYAVIHQIIDQIKKDANCNNKLDTLCSLIDVI